MNDSDIDFKWSISQQLPQQQASLPAAATATGAAGAATEPATAAAAAAAAGSSDAGRHYGILLAKMAGLPASVTDAALQITRRLDAKQQRRQQQQEGDGATQRLRQAYSLVHKLGCVARGAASQGLLEVDASGQPVGTETPAGVAGSSSGSSSGEFARCAQMVRQLKQEAEKLLLEAARQPVAS